METTKTKIMAICMTLAVIVSIITGSNTLWVVIAYWAIYGLHRIADNLERKD